MPRRKSRVGGRGRSPWPEGPIQHQERAVWESVVAPKGSGRSDGNPKDRFAMRVFPAWDASAEVHRETLRPCHLHRSSNLIQAST